MADPNKTCPPESINSEIRSFASHLRILVKRIGCDNRTKSECDALLRISSPKEFLESLLVPKFFLNLIEVIQPTYTNTECIQHTEAGLMKAAMTIGKSYGMRTPSDSVSLSTRLKWAWQLIRLDFQQEVSEKKHPDLVAIYDRMNVSDEEVKKLNYRQILLLWIAYQIKSSKNELIQKVTPPHNFTTSLSDGLVYLALFHEILPENESFEPTRLFSASAIDRISFIVQKAKSIGLGDFICEQDIIQGFDRVNLIFVASLLRTLPSLETFTILITRGIQNDYCGTDVKINYPPVHIGMNEAMRLSSRDSSIPGAIETLIHWARCQSDESFAIIHIRDIHDPNCPEQRHHLSKFGNHCLIGTEGSKLICHLLDDESQLAKNEFIIDINGINDLKDGKLSELIKKLKSNSTGKLLRVGVVGVNTDFQISYLIYELQSRLGIENLATCSALTATRNRRNHFSALQNLERNFDVTVFDSPADFSFWLSPNKTVSLCTISTRGSHIKAPQARLTQILAKIDYEQKTQILEEDCMILDALFRNSEKIKIVNRLTGGFSGAMVLLAESYDFDGHLQGPFVIKLGNIDGVATERNNFERIEEIIGNQAPYVYGAYEYINRAGIKFAFASHSGEVCSTKTFKETFADPQIPQSFINNVISKLSLTLNRFYVVAKMRPWDILASYNFDGRGWALAAGGSDDPVALANRIIKLLPQYHDITKEDNLMFPGGVQFYNVWKLISNLQQLIDWTANSQFLVSFVHGDLNYSNILIDASQNIWLIDFQYSSKAHYLKDLTKLENDGFLFETKLSNDQELEQAIKITQILHKHSPYDDTEALETELESIQLPMHLSRAVATALVIRKIVYQTNAGQEKDATAYYITMLRYSLHAMCFTSLSRWNRIWALASACSYSERLIDIMSTQTTSLNNSM